MFSDLPTGAAPASYGSLLGTSGISFMGVGVHANRGSIKVSGGNFIDCFFGLFGSQANTTVQNAQMDNVTAGVVALQPTALTAKNNAIRTLSLGINSAASDGLFNQIQGNDIQVGESKDGIGINVAVTGSAAPRIALVANNTVNMVGGTVGVQLSTPTQLTALANTVSIGQKMVGLKLEGGSRNTLRCNTVGLLTGGTGPLGATGLYAIHPAGGSVNCNTTSDVATGLSFQGVLGNHEFAAVSGNTLRNHNTGLAYGASTVTGPQVHQGNRWEGTFTVGAVNNSPFSADQSRYTVDVLEDPSFMPSSVIPFTWFEDENNPNPSYQCATNACPLPPTGQTGPINPSAQASYQMQVAQGTAASGEHAQANNWLAQRRLYQQLAASGDQGNSSLANFIAQSQNNGLASYANLQTALSQLMQISEGDAQILDSLSQAMAVKSAQILALEQQLAQWEVNPNDSTLWTTQKIALGESAGSDHVGYAAKWANIQTVRTAAVPTLLSQNAALTGTAPYQVNEKAVNEIFLQTVASGVVLPTSAQKGVLEAIAVQCPLSGGEAVLRARALLVALGSMPVVYDDEVLCFPSLYPVEDRSRGAMQVPGLWVFPNPTAGQLNVAWYGDNEASKTFVLYDLNGKTLQELTLEGASGSTHLDLGHLSSGIYVYLIKGGQQPIITGKVSVQH